MGAGEASLSVGDHHMDLLSLVFLVVKINCR